MSYFQKLELTNNAIAAQEGADTATGKIRVSAATADNFIHYSELTHDDRKNLWDKVKSGQPQQIYSEVLGEFVWWCRDEEQSAKLRRESIGVVPYSIDELRELVGKSPEDLRIIHNLKKRFKATLKQVEGLSDNAVPEDDLELVRCGECKNFSPDTIGDGTGAGSCTVGRHGALYPLMQRLCEDFTND